MRAIPESPLILFSRMTLFSRLILLIGIALGCFARPGFAFSAQEAIPVSSERSASQQMLLNFPIKYRAPSDASLSQENIVNTAAKDWTNVNGSPAISLGLADGDHWFYVKAKNATTNPVAAFLVIDNPLLDSVDVFVQNGNSSGITYHLGDTFVFSQRPIENPAFLIPLSILAGDDVAAFVRISNRDALKSKLYFVDQASYYRDSETNHILLLSLLTAMMALALYHFIFYFKTKETSFLFFSLFVSCAVFFFLVQSGYAFQWFWPDSPAWQNMADPFSLGVMATFAVLFAISNLDMASFSGQAKRNFLLVVAACVLGCVISIVCPYRVSLLYMFFVYAAVIAMGAWIGIKLWKQKLASYYMIAWGFLLLGSAVRLLYELAIIPQSAFSENAFLLGIALQVLFSGVGVAGRYNQEKQWRLDAQQSLLKEAQHAIEQEKQLSEAQSSLAKLKQEQAERLEIHVQQRTQALEIALQALQEAKHRAEAADKQKARFLAAASHDIRQPLNALSLMQESLNQAELAPSMHQRFAKMRQATDHLVRLFESLFDLSKLENDVVLPSWETIPVAPHLLRVKEALQPLFEAKGVQLIFADDANEVLCIRVDPVMLQRMLWILLDNALQHSQSTCVQLRLEYDEGHCYIAIEDNGIGIPAHEQQNIFEEFYQLNNLERNRSRGMGLGLALCQRLAKLLNVALDVTSQPGNGTCFRLQLERVASVKPSPSLSITPPIHGDRLVGLKVLLVEDDEENRYATIELLDSWGVDFRAAEDAAHTWQHINPQWQPDIALIDCRLPGPCNGVELAHALQRLAIPPAIIIISGEFDLPTQAENYRFMRKPIKPSRLRAQLTGMSHHLAASDR